MNVNPPNFPGAHRAPTRRLVRSRPLVRPRPLVELRAGVSDVELEEMESEQTGLAFSLPPSPDRARANSPVKFLPDFQFPSPKARDFVSFGLDNILPHGSLRLRGFRACFSRCAPA